MKIKTLQNMLTVRGDSLYCPLPVSLDSYGNCLVDCWHCYFRRLNYVWGQDLKPIDPENLRGKLVNGLKNPHPISSLAYALKQKKTLRFGNKADPFQPAEKEFGVSRDTMFILLEFGWNTVIQTRFTDQALEYEDIFMEGKDIFILMPVISPGLEKDWEILERSRTTNPLDRISCAAFFVSKGLQVGINGEPFIPGFHTVKDFENILKLLKSNNLKSYNTYNFHWNDFVAKRLIGIGIDIERIWFYNQDNEWRKILIQLIDLARKYNIDLGCPDFVNSGSFVQRANTCCGIDVKNPCTFNVVTWKKMRNDQKKILEKTWDGIGDYESGRKVMYGETEDEDFFTMKDINKDIRKGLLV